MGNDGSYWRKRIKGFVPCHMERVRMCYPLNENLMSKLGVESSGLNTTFRVVRKYFEMLEDFNDPQEKGFACSAL